MFPIQLSLFEYTLNLHLVFETLAFVIGFRYFLFLRRRQSDPINETNRMWIFIGASAGAFVFSRLVGSLENPQAWAQTDHPVLYFYSNKTIVGALLGGLFVVEVTKYFLKEKKSSGDLFTYPLILAMIIGRIGCFTSGIHEPTFGNESNLPWALDLGDGINRHPITLYEILFLLTLWFVIFRLEKSDTLAMGMKFKIFLITYLIFRFSIEFIKPAIPLIGPFTTIQVVCLAGIFYYTRTISLIFTRKTVVPIK